MFLTLTMVDMFFRSSMAEANEVKHDEGITMESGNTESTDVQSSPSQQTDQVSPYDAETAENLHHVENTLRSSNQRGLSFIY